MQANRKIHHVSEQAPIYMLSHSKAPRSKFSFADILEKLLLWQCTGVDLSSRNNFTKDPLQKFLFLFNLSFLA